MNKAKKWLIGSGAVVLALAGGLAYMASRVPRSSLSVQLKFLDGVEPYHSAYEDQLSLFRLNPGDPWRKSVALVEDFDLPVGFAKATDLARPDLKPRAYSSSYWPHAKPAKTIYSVTDPETKKSVVVTIVYRGPDHTHIRIVTPKEPGPMERFLERFRGMFTPKKS